ncbi:MAG: hypothetical protein LBP64_07680 [Tannerella sp.]|jgi:hypothetical protein|nr:hypothetical protein [Tannerella sp.]
MCAQVEDLYVAIATIAAVFISGAISVFITLYQVKKENKNTLKQLDKQYQNTIRQMREETNILKYRKLNEQKLEALQRCWGLLIYSTDLENSKSIITYNEIQRRENRQTIVEKKEYFFNKAQIDEFIDTLQQFYFADGWGMYLSDELKTLLFEYRNILFGIRLKEIEGENNVVKFKNSHTAVNLLELHNNMANMLRLEMITFFNTDPQENA